MKTQFVKIHPPFLRELSTSLTVSEGRIRLGDNLQTWHGYATTITITDFL